EVAADELPDRIDVRAEETEGKGGEAVHHHVEVPVAGVVLDIGSEQEQVGAASEIETKSRHAAGGIGKIDRFEQKQNDPAEGDDRRHRRDADEVITPAELLVDVLADPGL